ncbi:hypothetical protein [Burkholderia sp. Ac-20379]|uniref:hypothetical protein n=1 Tax=Burkholderia sp. Ac-20379 TaxID=2703900 RepID=UPI00197D924A|nr:hypothetical protein [Burkholderia sp. Ac-20379]MBN3727392.1 hypothetical protein [Burkholderia sp. Ac-20379]
MATYGNARRGEAGARETSGHAHSRGGAHAVRQDLGTHHEACDASGRASSNRCDDGACIMSAAARPLACAKQRKARLPEETPTRFA